MKSTLIRITLISFLLVLFFPNLTFAEIKIFIKEYTYQASEYDSKVSCRVLALEQVKRLLLEELGTYLESETEVKNFRLTKDQITALTAGVVQMQILKESWDGNEYWMQSQIAADPNDVIKAINALRKDRQKVKELEESRKKAEVLSIEIEKLKKELKLAKTDLKKLKYEKTINELSAADWFEKGLVLYDKGKYEEARDAFSKVIEIIPKHDRAYFGRGMSYINLKKFDEAYYDFQKELKLNPKDSLPHYGLGIYYVTLKRYKEAIGSLNKAIELRPKYAEYYSYRGKVYYELEEFKRAINDFTMAIKLDSKNANVYFLRGRAYTDNSQRKKAINDYNIAIQLDPLNSGYYVARAEHYLFNHDIGMIRKSKSQVSGKKKHLNLKWEARKDLDKAILLNPNNAEAYHYRAATQANEELQIADYTKAIELDPTLSGSYFRRGRNLSMKMRHLRQKFSVPPDRFLEAPVC